MGVQFGHERSADRPITASPNGPGEGSRPDAHRPRQTGTIRTERRPADERGDAAEHGGLHRAAPRTSPRSRTPGTSARTLARAAETRPGMRGPRPHRRTERMTRAPSSVGLVPFRSDRLCSAARRRAAPLTGCAGQTSPIRVANLRSARTAQARRATGALLDLRPSRPVGRHPPRRRGRGLYRTHPHPGQGHPARARRSRRPRRRPDRDRQDRGLHAADPRAAEGPGELELLARAPPGPGPDGDADPRAGDADRRQRRGLRPPRPAPHGRRLRRRPDRAPDQGAAVRGRDPRRDAGPADGPRRAAHGQPVAGRDPGPRRGRPDARHGVHPGHPQDRRPPPGASARTCCSAPRSRTRSGGCRRSSCTTPRRSRSPPGTPPPRASSRSSTRSTATARRTC